jgi:trk system potassium uptake protein TrkH
MFEAFSASGTVGVSLSLTGSLNLSGKIAVMLMMYFGRVGILTVSYAVMARLSESKKEFKNAEANVMVG